MAIQNLAALSAANRRAVIMDAAVEVNRTYIEVIAFKPSNVGSASLLVNGQTSELSAAADDAILPLINSDGIDSVTLFEYSAPHISDIPVFRAVLDGKELPEFVADELALIRNN